MSKTPELELLQMKYNLLKKKYDLQCSIIYLIETGAKGLLLIDNRVKDEKGNWVIDTSKAFNFISGLADKNSRDRIDELFYGYQKDLDLLNSINH